MAERVYSTQFIAIQGLSAAHTVTIDDSHVGIVRDIDVYATGAIAIPFTFVFAQGSDGQAFFYYQWDPGAQAWEGWRGRQVIEPGQTFTVTPSNGAVDVSVSGYLLSSP